MSVKRSEIKIGAVLFWGTSPQWEESDRDTAKVEVTGLWAKKPGNFSRSARPIDVPEGSSGAGIKVKILETSAAGWLGRVGEERTAVLGHLRGKYDEVQPGRLEYQARIAKHQRETRERKDRETAEALALRARAWELLGTKSDRIERVGDRDFRVTRKTMELLLDLAAGIETIEIDANSGLVVSRSYDD